MPRTEQLGSWLKVNGEAIYGTKPWKATPQWSEGEVPKIDYNVEFNAAGGPQPSAAWTKKP